MMVLSSIIVAIAIIVSALLLKDTAYENTWLYILCVWLVLNPLLELYLKKRGKSK